MAPRLSQESIETDATKRDTSRHRSTPLYAIDVVHSTPLIAQLKRQRDSFETLCQYCR